MQAIVERQNRAMRRRWRPGVRVTLQSEHIDRFNLQNQRSAHVGFGELSRPISFYTRGATHIVEWTKCRGMVTLPPAIDRESDPAHTAGELARVPPARRSWRCGRKREASAYLTYPSPPSGARRRRPIVRSEEPFPGCVSGRTCKKRARTRHKRLRKSGERTKSMADLRT